jgi:hypothetical protein
MSERNLLEDLREEFRASLSAVSLTRSIGTTPERALAEQSAVKLRYWIARIDAHLKTGGWISERKTPEKDGFYLCYTKCPPQSHPVQTVRFKTEGWLTSWDVLYYQPLPPLPGERG